MPGRSRKEFIKSTSLYKRGIENTSQDELSRFCIKNWNFHVEQFLLRSEGFKTDFCGNLAFRRMPELFDLLPVDSGVLQFSAI